MSFPVIARASAVCLAFGLAAPLSAAQWIVLAGGTTNAGSGPPGNTLAGVPFGNLPLFAAFLISSKGTPVSLAPLGNTGTNTRFDGAIIDVFISVGPWTITQNANSTRSVFVLDNGAPSAMTPSLRLDQISMSGGFTFEGDNFVPHLATDAPLDDGVFLSSYNLARSYSLTGSDPDLVTGPGFPDLEAIFDPAASGTRFFTLNFRRGSPTTPAQHAALPQVTFSVVGLEVLAFMTAGPIPEPATWAFLVAGFGLVGTVLRRRRVAPAT